MGRVNDVQTAVRMPDDLVARLDAHAKRLSDAQPGVKVSRSDAIRALLLAALAAQERQR